ncbi:MAG TPA: S-layer homology domain-containing protein [Candidatus Peribacterales bacterium]|nr:S-layer homology domain-containing protein [Candidatus Peribacterales bacterium]
MRRLLITAMLLMPLIAGAVEPPYLDILPDAWYIEEVQSFLDQGYLDGAQTTFRAGDRATRAEFIKLIVEVNGGILDEIPTSSAFGDVSPGDWYFGYLEESAREGWTRGDGNCFVAENRGKDAARTCHVRPNDSITRAEAAVLVQRAFGRKRLGKAPAFADNASGEWYTDAVQAAADHCILRGDDGTRSVRPFDPVNRAEMVAMLYRVDGGGEYPECL